MSSLGCKSRVPSHLFHSVLATVPSFVFFFQDFNVCIKDKSKSNNYPLHIYSHFSFSFLSLFSTSEFLESSGRFCLYYLSFKSVIQLYFHKSSWKQNFHVNPHNVHKETHPSNTSAQTQPRRGSNAAHCLGHSYSVGSVR